MSVDFVAFLLKYNNTSLFMLWKTPKSVYLKFMFALFSAYEKDLRSCMFQND